MSAAFNITHKLQAPLNLIKKHPSVTELFTATAFGIGSHFCHDIPGLFLVCRGMVVSEIFGAISHTAPTPRPWGEHLIVRSGSFLAGVAVACLMNSAIFEGSTPDALDLDPTLSKIVSTCPQKSTPTLIPVRAQKGFSSQQLNLTAVIDSVDFGKNEITTINGSGATTNISTFYEATYTMNVTGNVVVKDLWDRGYSLQPVGYQQFPGRNFAITNCRRNMVSQVPLIK